MDVLDLKKYYATPLGKTARRLIGARLRALPSPPAGSRVLGLGYAAPWLDRYRGADREVFSVMPPRLGVVRWPREGLSASLLAAESALPFPDASIDLALVAHGLELAGGLPGLLKELWRVLAAHGHAIFIVPNRRGVWARLDSTPYGHGRPFSRRQLETVLERAGLKPVHVQPALFVPPVEHRFILRAAPAWERMGRTFWPGFSGVLVMEAIKQVYALRGQDERPAVFPDLQPVTTPSLGQARE